MIRLSIICAIANAITVLVAAFIFLHYIFHETTGADAEEMNSEEIEQYRHHKRLLPASEHFTNSTLIRQHYCPPQQVEQCSLKAFSFCGNSSRSISLTFDVDQRTSKKSLDGIIEELRGVNVPATFFFAGEDSVDHEDRCQSARSLIQAGHQVEIMNWNGAELQSGEPIEALDIDKAKEFLRDCLRKKSSEPLQFRPIRGQITLDQARAVSQRYHAVIAMWSLSSDPDLVEHLIDLAEDDIGRSDSIVVRLHNLEYWSRSGPMSKLVSHFQGRQYKFMPTGRCYDQCPTDVCLAPVDPW